MAKQIVLHTRATMKMNNTKKAPLTMTAKQADAKGYSMISRASCLAARIDRTEWRENMAASHASGMQWVKALGALAGDHYRRLQSQDVIVVPKSWVRLLPNSGNGPNKFLA